MSARSDVLAEFESHVWVTAKEGGVKEEEEKTVEVGGGNFFHTNIKRSDGWVQMSREASDGTDQSPMRVKGAELQ